MEYGPPPSPPPSPDRPESPPRRPSRIRGLLAHPQASAVLLALLIGYASILSAVLAWRASLASIDSSRYESLAVQEQARIQQIEHQLQGTVAQDQRFINAFQEHALAARELQAQADSLRESDPDAADILDLEASARMDLARAIQPFFLGASGVALADDGSVPYDTEFVLRNLREGNIEHRELTRQQTTALAERADIRALSLIGVAAVIVAALFFLTIAQVMRSRAGLRQAFLAAGAVLVLFGSVGFVLVELLA